MAEQAATYIEQLQARFPDAILGIAEARGEVTLEVPSANWHAACLSLRDDFGFEQLVDLCGVDYLGYGSDEWETANVSSEGFSRGVELGFGPGRFTWENRPRGDGPVHRFATVAHLRSYQHNRLLRVRCYRAERRTADDRVGDRYLARCQLVRARGVRPVRHPLRRPSGPAPHPHRLRFRRPSVPQGFPADRQRGSALRRGEEARDLRAGDFGRAARRRAARDPRRRALCHAAGEASATGAAK